MGLKDRLVFCPKKDAPSMPISWGAVLKRTHPAYLLAGVQLSASHPALMDRPVLCFLHKGGGLCLRKCLSL